MSKNELIRQERLQKFRSMDNDALTKRYNKAVDSYNKRGIYSHMQWWNLWALENEMLKRKLKDKAEFY